jgi:hypothetical protein
MMPESGSTMRPLGITMTSVESRRAKVPSILALFWINYPTHNNNNNNNNNNNESNDGNDNNDNNNHKNKNKNNND